jgi:thiamine-phosphate diphosphorylase
MTPFVAAQIHSIIEDIRLLEAFVTAPLGLHSDIRTLRQVLPLPEAEDLSLEESQKRRIAYRALSHKPAHLALETIRHIEASMAVLRAATDGGYSPLSVEWAARLRRVLTRAERHVAGGLRSESAARVQGLYVILDPQATRGRSVSEVALAALKGDAGVIRLRDKSGDKGGVLPVAREIKSMCDAYDALFIMNDDPSIALSSEAHGLHLDQRDIPVPEARQVLMPDQILGRTSSTVDEVAKSQALGVDYLAVGPIYPSASMGNDAVPAVGVEIIEKTKEIASQPVVASGGITAENITEVVRAGANSVCVGSAVTSADDPEAAARSLAQAIQKAKVELEE